jgi:hypothetical protein
MNANTANQLISIKHETKQFGNQLPQQFLGFGLAEQIFVNFDFKLLT